MSNEQRAPMVLEHREWSDGYPDTLDLAVVRGLSGDLAITVTAQYVWLDPAQALEAANYLRELVERVTGGEFG